MKFEKVIRRLAEKAGCPQLEQVILGELPISVLPETCLPWRGNHTRVGLRVKKERGSGNLAYPTMVHDQGYGVIKIGGKKTPVHRYIFQLIYRPKFEYTMRKQCGTPLCCNPLHWTIRPIGEEPQKADIPEPVMELEPWSQAEVNDLLDQAFVSYDLSSWEEIISNPLMLDCPHDMIKVALKSFRKEGLLP